MADIDIDSVKWLSAKVAPDIGDIPLEGTMEDKALFMHATYPELTLQEARRFITAWYDHVLPFLRACKEFFPPTQQKRTPCE